MMGITLSEGMALVFKIGAFVLIVSIVDALLEEAGKKEWIVKVNIIAGVTCVMTIFKVVKDAFDIIQVFSNMVN